MTPTRVSFLSLIVALLAAGQAAIAQSPPPAASQPQVPPEVERVLDRGEAAGAKLVGLRAAMKYERNQTLVGEVSTRKGAVAYLKRSDPKQQGVTLFLIRFDTLETDVFTSTKKETYVFDGQSLHELNEKTQQLIHREVVRPGEKLNPMRLGEGPFPAPFGQTKADVLDNFTVKLIPAAPKDPKGADHLEMTPIKGKDLAKKYKKIHLFVSQAIDLPVRMITDGTNDEVVTVDFTDIEVNPKDLTEKSFVLEKPRGYAESTEKLGKD